MADTYFYDPKTQDVFTGNEEAKDRILQQQPHLVLATPDQIDQVNVDIKTREGANTWGGVGKVFGGQLADEALMGIPEAIYDARATEADRRAKDIYKEENPIANTVGGVLGFVGGLAYGPAAGLMKIGTKVGGRAVKNKLGQAAIANAVEGGLYGATTNTIRATTDPNFTAEDAVSESLKGAFLGGVVGGAAGPIAKVVGKGAGKIIDAGVDFVDTGKKVLINAAADTVMQAGPVKTIVEGIEKPISDAFQTLGKKTKPIADSLDEVLLRKASDTDEGFFNNVHNNIFKPDAQKKHIEAIYNSAQKDADVYNNTFNNIQFTGDNIIDSTRRKFPEHADAVAELYSKQDANITGWDTGSASKVPLSKIKLGTVLTEEQSTTVLRDVAENIGLKDKQIERFARGIVPESAETISLTRQHVNLIKDRPLHFLKAMLGVAVPLMSLTGVDMGTAFTLGAIAKGSKPAKDWIKDVAIKNSAVIDAGVDTLFSGSVAARSVHMFQNKDEKQLAELTSDINRNSQDLDLLTDQLALSTSEMSPEVADPYRTKFMEVITSVAESAPKVEYDRFGQAKPVPPAQMSKYRQELQVAFDPYSIIKDLESNTITKIQVDSLRKLYPAIYGAITESILEKVTDGDVKISANKKRTFDLFMQEKTSPEYIKSYQSMYVEANQPAQMGGGNSINAGDRLKTITLK